MSYLPRVRLTPAHVFDRRLGSRDDWLPAWHEQVQESADDPQLRGELTATLMDKICDTQNLMVAFQRTGEKGGDTPGPDGLRTQDFTLSRAGAVSRTLSAAMCRGGIEARSA